MPPVAQRRTTLVALAAAFVILAQSFFTAWAAASMPLGPQLDAFGNPLCFPDRGNGDSSTDHSKLPNCCTYGCSMVSMLLPVPDSDGTNPALQLSSLDAPFAFGKDIIVPTPDHDPGSPRAPPSKA